MKYLPDDNSVCTACFGIYSFYPDQGWMRLNFLGDSKSFPEAVEKLREYLAQPENQSCNPERYQIRHDITEHITVLNASWDPKGTVEFNPPQ